MCSLHDDGYFMGVLPCKIVRPARASGSIREVEQTDRHLCGWLSQGALRRA